MTPSKWLADNLTQVVVALAQAGAALEIESVVVRTADVEAP
jgi:hypothetical protein